ncbi:Rho GTPase activation protein [Lactarius pseudohatsudake]|nr:Rho GTPase activation protein [Lactarius pseudohatsudake]
MFHLSGLITISFSSSIDSLRKLHRKATIVDASFDPRAEPTTTRAAWDKVRDNLEGEADAQQAFVDILENDVIQPLTNLKETEDRTRKRVEEDLGESAAKYADHAENTILKLQQEYWKKYHPRIGGKSSALFRDRQEDTPASTPVREFEPSKSEEVFDDDCRRAVGFLNTLRLKRVENLDDAYDCLAALVFTPTVKNVLVKYMDGMTTACTKHIDLAMSTSAEALAGTDASGLRASFGHALSISIPPLTLYCNYRPDVYSDLIFGVPLVNLSANQDCVPKVIRMCIEEVEKRGLNTHKIYLVGSIYDAEILQLRRRFESEETFSFSSTDNIHSVAMLLKLYLWDLPKPLFMLSLEDCRKYRQDRARYPENVHSMLRSKIRELHPVHRASLEAVLRHLLLVASHSDKNAMTVEALAAQFCYTVLRGNAVLEGSVHAKKLVMEDLIQNAHTLFDERPPQSSFSSMPPSRPESILSNTSDISLSAASLLSSTTEFPSSPAASLLSSTTESPPSPAASLQLSTTGAVFPAISERF